MQQVSPTRRFTQVLHATERSVMDAAGIGGYTLCSVQRWPAEHMRRQEPGCGSGNEIRTMLNVAAIHSSCVDYIPVCVQLHSQSAVNCIKADC
jgi:hypothetical protein